MLRVRKWVKMMYEKALFNILSKLRKNDANTTEIIYK